MIHPHLRVLKFCQHLTQEAENRQVPVEQIYEASDQPGWRNSVALDEASDQPGWRDSAGANERRFLAGQENRRFLAGQEENLSTSSDQRHTTYIRPREAVTEIDPLIHPHSLSHEDRHVRIAIVGAGIAGLNAALTLQDAGLSCRIYEASNRVGGRMHSDTTTWADGMVTEWCGEFIDSDHETIRHLIERFGLKTINLEQEIADQAQSIMYFFNRYYSAEELLGGFQAIYPILRQQVQEVGFPTTHTHFTETGYQLDHMSVYDWIEQYVEGGHDAPLGHMLDGACTGFYGLDTRAQSSLNLVYMFGSRDSGDRPTISGPMQGSLKIAGGNQQLPLAIAGSLPEGCIQLNHQLVAIKRHSDDSITLSFATSKGFSEVSCDHVILALPFRTLRQVDYQQADFDPLKHVAITQLGYGTISKLFLQFDTRYWYQDGPWSRANNGFIITDLDIQVLWDTSLGQPGAHGILVDYTSGSRGASYTPTIPYSNTADSEKIQQYAQNCLKQLEHVLPGISAHYTGTAALSYPTGDPYLRGSYACWCVGQYTHFGGYEGVRQGPVHFAGEHCSITAQGFMEGGAREGVRAAREILADYGMSS